MERFKDGDSHPLYLLFHSHRRLGNGTTRFRFRLLPANPKKPHTKYGDCPIRQMIDLIKLVKPIDALLRRTYRKTVIVSPRYSILYCSRDGIPGHPHNYPSRIDRHLQAREQATRSLKNFLGLLYLDGVPVFFAEVFEPRQCWCCSIQCSDIPMVAVVV